MSVDDCSEGSGATQTPESSQATDSWTAFEKLMAAHAGQVPLTSNLIARLALLEVGVFWDVCSWLRFEVWPGGAGDEAGGLPRPG